MSRTIDGARLRLLGEADAEVLDEGNAEARERLSGHRSDAVLKLNMTSLIAGRANRCRQEHSPARGRSKRYAVARADDACLDDACFGRRVFYTTLAPPSTATICPVMCCARRTRRARRALEVLVAAEAAERRFGDHRSAMLLERRARHLRREETGADRVHRDAVLAPLAGERAREVHDAALRGVVGDRAHPLGQVAPEARRSRRR